MEKNTQQFKDNITQFIESWKSIDLRVIASKYLDAWYFHAIIAVLDHKDESKPTLNTLPTVNDLLVYHVRRGIASFESILSSIASGNLEINDEDILVKKWDGKSVSKEAPQPRYEFYERKRCNSEFGIDYASHVFVMWQTFQIRNLDRINDHLRSGEFPWDGIRDLRENFLNLKDVRANRTDASNVFLIAPLKVRIEEASITSNSVKIEIDRSPLTQLESITLSAIAHFQSGKIERTLHEFKSQEYTINYDETPLFVTLIVSYQNVVVDRAELFGVSNNQRITAFKHIYGEIDEFVFELEEGGKQLESKIALLFHLLGFNTAHYGYGTQERPDLVAFSKDNHTVLVVECTKREPDLNNKLTKLSTRTKELQGLLKEYIVTPVIITSFEESMINQSDKNKANIEKTPIITQENIIGLIQLASDNVSTSDVIEHINGKIPRQGRNGFQ